MPKITNDWLDAIGAEFQKPYYLELRQRLIQEYRTQTIYPKPDDIFNAFHFTPLSQVKAVIIGQDPYINENQAMGTCFSVPRSQKTLPPSLRNIYKELHDDLGLTIPSHGDLRKWSDQGVLMFNAVLTVRAHQSNSHQGWGWEHFTDAAIAAVNRLERPVVFLLWGAYARRKKELLNNPRHLILEAAHPSPLSANNGFFGCRHFSKANEFLRAHGVEPIDWQIDE